MSGLSRAIEDLNISDKAKVFLNHFEFYDYLQEPIILSDNQDIVYEKQKNINASL